MARKSREWSKEETMELIATYDENSILWDSTNVEYRNREKKNKILHEIAIKFNCTSEEVQRKLHNLRNQVSQEIKKLRKKKSGNGTDENYSSNWPYFTALEFLVPVLTANHTQSSMATTSSLHSEITETINEVEAEPEEQMPNEVEVSIGNPKNREKAEPQRTTKQTATKRKHRNDEDDKLFKKALETLQKPPDADDRFGEYVAMELKGLRSEYNKRRLKSEIRRAVARIVDEEDHMYDYPTSSSTTSPSPGFYITTPLPSPTQQIQPSGEETTQSCREFVNSFQYSNL